MTQGIALRAGHRLAAMGLVSVVGALALLGATSLPVSAAASVSDRALVTADGSANDPSVATDGTDFLVVWTQTVSNVLEVFAAQVKGDGTEVHPLGALSTTGDLKNDDRPSVAWDGSKYLIAWQHDFSSTDTDLLGRIVTRAGFVKGLIIISNTSANQSAPSVTALGSTFLVVWADDRNGNLDIFRGRVKDDGTVVDNSGVEVTSGTSIDYAPDVATNGSGFLVTYQRQTANLTSIDLYGQRLNGSAAGVGGKFPISESSDVEEAPKVASDGKGYLVVWNQSNAGDILGATVGAAGAVAGPISISTAPSTQDLPDVAFNGSYLVSWRDARGGPAAAFAARVGSDGSVQDPSGFVVDPGQGSGGFVGGPAVSAAPGSHAWAVTFDLYSGGGIIERTATGAK